MQRTQYICNRFVIRIINESDDIMKEKHTPIWIIRRARNTRINNTTNQSPTKQNKEKKTKAHHQQKSTKKYKLCGFPSNSKRYTECNWVHYAKTHNNRKFRKKRYRNRQKTSTDNNNNSHCVWVACVVCALCTETWSTINHFTLFRSMMILANAYRHRRRRRRRSVFWLEFVRKQKGIIIFIFSYFRCGVCYMCVWSGMNDDTLSLVIAMGLFFCCCYFLL